MGTCPRTARAAFPLSAASTDAPRTRHGPAYPWPCALRRDSPSPPHRFLVAVDLATGPLPPPPVVRSLPRDLDHEAPNLEAVAMKDGRDLRVEVAQAHRFARSVIRGQYQICRRRWGWGWGWG